MGRVFFVVKLSLFFVLIYNRNSHPLLLLHKIWTMQEPFFYFLIKFSCFVLKVNFNLISFFQQLTLVSQKRCCDHRVTSSFPWRCFIRLKKRCLSFSFTRTRQNLADGLNRVDIFLARPRIRGAALPCEFFSGILCSSISPTTPPLPLIRVTFHTCRCRPFKRVMTRANTTRWMFNDSVKEVKARHLHRAGALKWHHKAGCSPVQMLLWRCVGGFLGAGQEGVEEGAGRWSIPSNTQELLAGMC